MSWLEVFAVITGILTLILLVRNNVWNWPVGIVSVIAFAFLFFEIKLYADVILQIFFIVTGLIGWWLWTHGGENRSELPITTLTNNQRVLTVIGLVIACLASGYFFDTFTDASLPYIDSIVTGMSIVAQILLMRRKIDNWVIWIVMDFVAIGLYFYKGIYLTTGLYVIFLIMSTIGLFTWIRLKKEEERRAKFITNLDSTVSVEYASNFADLGTDNATKINTKSITLEGPSEAAKVEGVCHTQQECVELYRNLDPVKRKGAVNLLKDKLAPYREELLAEVEKDPENWISLSHFHWGMGVRNGLRQAGFGEKELGVHNLDCVYVALIEEALGVTIDTGRR